jgi:hypothetical protein
MECVPQSPDRKNAWACIACAQKKWNCISASELAAKVQTPSAGPSTSALAPTATPDPAATLDAPAKLVKRCSAAGELISPSIMKAFMTSPTAKSNKHLELLRTILATIQKDGQEMRDRMYNLEIINRAMCAQTGVKPATLPLCIPSVPAFDASSPSPSVLSTSAASAISTASSSSAVHMQRMSNLELPGDGMSHSSVGTLQCESSEYIVTPYSNHSFTIAVLPPCSSRTVSKPDSRESSALALGSRPGSRTHTS